MITSNEGDRILCIQNKDDYDTDVYKAHYMNWGDDLEVIGTTYI